MQNDKTKENLKEEIDLLERQNEDWEKEQQYHQKQADNFQSYIEDNNERIEEFLVLINDIEKKELDDDLTADNQEKAE